MLIPVVPRVVKSLIPKLIWSVPVIGNEVFITFDDGPIPEVTPRVLELLDRYNAKATFFCVGDNVRKYPEVYQMVLDGGHAVGNHTFHHLHGATHDIPQYVEDVQFASTYIDSPLFRPPYGFIRPLQQKALNKSYRIIMWSVMTYDYRQDLSWEDCYELAIRKTPPGSIIVFHDSLKSQERMFPALEKFLQWGTEHNLSFAAIDASALIEPRATARGSESLRKANGRS